MELTKQNPPLLEELARYGQALNTHDILKAIGIILMVIDHVGAYLLNDEPWFRLVGRGAAPLFFFLIGYVNHLRIRTSLLIYGIILSGVGYLQYGHFWINILINFIFIAALLYRFPMSRIPTIWRMIAFILLLSLHWFISIYLEYGLLGFLIAASGQLLATKDKQAPFWLLISLVSYFAMESLAFNFTPYPQRMAVFGVLIICLYAGLVNYRLKTVNIAPLFALPLEFLSRYSLPIYFYHLIALIMYSILSKQFYI